MHRNALLLFSTDFVPSHYVNSSCGSPGSTRLHAKRRPTIPTCLHWQSQSCGRTRRVAPHATVEKETPSTKRLAPKRRRWEESLAPDHAQVQVKPHANPRRKRHHVRCLSEDTSRWAQTVVSHTNENRPKLAKLVEAREAPQQLPVEKKRNEVASSRVAKEPKLIG